MNAQHRPDRAIELVKPILGELVTPFIRAVCAALAVGYLLMGWTPLTNPDSPAYARPLFDVVFAIADPRAWGAVFMLCAAGLLLTAITARAGIYLLSLVASTIALGAWASTIIYTAITSDEAILSSAGAGLFVICFVGVVGLALSPRQLANGHRVIARLEHTDDNVVELREVRRGA